MIARSLALYQEQFPDLVVFASGVANSQTVNPEDYEREYQLLYRVLHHCRQQQKRLVYFSSGGAVYGNIDEVRDETTPVYPITLYGRHKLVCETLITHSGAPYLILRLANLVGDKQNRSQLIPALVEQIKAGKVKLFKNATRDLLDVEDFGKLLVCLLDTHHENDLVIVASGLSIPIVEIFHELQCILKTDVEPLLLDRGDSQRFSISKLRRILPQTPSLNADYFRSILRKYTVI